MVKQQVPVIRAEGDHGVVLSREVSTPPTIAATLSELTRAMQKTITGMDDVSLELDASPDRLRVRLRAYRHRDNRSNRGDDTADR
jgi:hypothetical protein